MRLRGRFLSQNAAVLVLLTALAVLPGCSSVRPWANQALAPGQPEMGETHEDRDPSMLVAVTLSGGGARAAAFGYGVLRAMQQTRFQWNGATTNLLAQTDMVSGVSGGSIVAAYLAAFGDVGFTGFEPDYLRKDFQDRVIEDALHPGTLHALTSPWYGRTDLLIERLNQLYQGRTYGDLLRHPERPNLLITATDMSQGTGFEFSPGQFGLICSDLRSVPLAFAVAASSAVPLVLSPVTVRNYANQCAHTDLNAPGDGNPLVDYRARLLHAQQLSYLDATGRPYVHLVDGGLSDNLGVRRLLDQVIGAGGLRNTLQGAGFKAGSVRRLVLISVNSERDPSTNIDASDQIPSNAQVVDTLLFGTGTRTTRETQEFLADVARQWRAELATRPRPGQDVFAADAEVHVIQVNLRDTPSALGRRALLQIPTAFSISAQEVTQLIEAGAATLRESPEMQALVRSLPPAPAEPAPAAAD